MAVKIIHQQNKIALVGSASSAAGLKAGHERAPAALRAAGLTDRLKAAGFEVADQGDTAPHVFQPDDEHPRARNVPAILKALNDLRPRVEAAVKTGGLPLILCGDCIAVMATVAGVRRYYRNVGLIYMDRDADLNVPATTPSGCVDGMVISQVIGRGAPELTRFWGEPPLVREPDVALFGFERLDPPEEQFLVTSALRRHPAMEVSIVGGAVAARAALERVHAANHQFVLHFDVDVISSEEFSATDFPGPGGLSWNAAVEALRVFAAQPSLAAFEIAGYNPELDPDGAAARRLVDLLVEVLSPRLAQPSAEAAAAPAPAEVVSVDTAVPPAPGEAASAEPTHAAQAEPVAETPSDASVPPEPDSIPS